jgi:hypothetical protein
MGFQSQPDAASILLLACYELGHQPLSLAWPLAALRQAGLNATAVDLSVDPFPVRAAQAASFIGIAVPMHTALRLGVRAAEQARAVNPGAHLCFYGLYAHLNADFLLAGLADSVISGEVESPLVAWAARHVGERADAPVPAGVMTREQAARPHLERLSLPVPDRTSLPSLSHYARLERDGRMELAGAVVASRGCLHTCRHCPVVPVYGGRFFVVPVETVMADIRQQVAAGARHISFADPDFLNGPGHAMRLARALHAEFPGLTFDFTTKVEHILQHRRLIPELRALGAAFVISAFESTSDDVLARLHKGHTWADMEIALDILRAAGLPVQPTWLPFTPWSTIDDYLDLLRWIREQALIAHVPAVQLSIRLLVPPHSALLDEPDTSAWLGPLDAPNFTYHWTHPDPCMDALQREVARVAEGGGDDPFTVFAAIERLAHDFAGRPAPSAAAEPVNLHRPPRLTEDWFC